MTDYTGPTPDDYRDFGEDLVSFAQRAATPIVQQRTAEIEQQLRETQKEVRQQRIERALDNDPVTRDRWRKTNVDPQFLNWLDGVHELSGERRRDILRRSEFYGNADAVVAMFKTFILEQMLGRVDAHKPLPYQNPQTPAPSGSNRRFTRQQIAEFYEDCRKGKYLKKEAERARIEADILAAARESRIVDPPMKLSRGHAA